MATRNDVGVWVRCEGCGRQRLPIGSVVMRHCVDDGRHAVRWSCAACGVIHVAAVTSGEALELARGGVCVETWTVPGELHERRRDTPRLTADEVLDWHLALRRPGWLEAAVADL